MAHQEPPETHKQEPKVNSGKPPSLDEKDYLKEYDLPARPRGTIEEQVLPEEKDHREPVLDDKETAARIEALSKRQDDDITSPVQDAGANFNQHVSDKDQDKQVDLAAQQTALGPNVSSNDE